MHPARGSKMATETARAGCGAGAVQSRAQRGPTTRLLLVVALAGLLVASPAASAPSVVSAAAGSAGRDFSHAPAATVGAPASTQPLILAKGRKPRRHSGAASVGLFTASPATLPAAGGTVRLLAVVQGATSCRFTGSTTLESLPATRRCSSGKVSVEVKLPRNTTSSQRIYHFQLVAGSSRGATKTAPVAVVERASHAPATAPVIKTQPASRSVVAGSSVTFAAATSGSASVQWEVSTDGGHSWSDIAGANADSYTLVAETGESGYDYRAVFSSHGRTTPTAAARLTVSAAAAGSANAQQGAQGTVSAGASDQAPVIALQPVGDAVVKGSTATFTAAASGVPPPSVQWQVSVNGVTWTTASGTTSTTYLNDTVSTTYSFPASLSDNAHEYRAVFSNSGGSVITNVELLDVVMYVIPPGVTTQPLSQTVVVGAQVTFSAAASGGVPSPSVQWQVSMDGGSTWGDAPGAATSTTYVFTALIGQNGYEYRAQFINGAAPVDTQPATLTVSEPVAPAITTEPITDNAFVGSSASFTATASGIPAPAVQWWISTDGGPWTAISGATSTTYSFDPTLGQNGAELEAVFTNVAGSATSNPATLTVSVPLSSPQITEQPESQAVALGSNVTFSASASGNPPPTVQWQVSTDGGSTWGNVAGATSSSYTLTSTETESGYEFRAVFLNSQGTTDTGAATLTVGDDPTSTFNWSGYGATATDGTFTSVNGDWTVPSATCPSSAPTYSAEWIGIDGDLVSSSVEQDGTDSDCSGGIPNYYAWYEMYPLPSVTISSPGHDVVAPGDSMSAAVSSSGFTWTLEIQDLTAGWTSSYVHVESGLDQASAEWIAERPLLCANENCTQTTLSSLADFGSVTFSGATADGESISSPSLSASAIQMTSNSNTNTLLALPGPITGSGFTDTWYGGS